MCFLCMVAAQRELERERAVAKVPGARPVRVGETPLKVEPCSVGDDVRVTISTDSGDLSVRVSARDLVRAVDRALLQRGMRYAP